MTAADNTSGLIDCLHALAARALVRHTTYAGIGSRETPLEVQAVMTGLATLLEQWGLVLRSGGAAGADSAFARGTAQPASREIFVPWERFAEPLYHGEEVVATAQPTYGAAEALAAEHHPNWQACRAGARKLHSRNMMQILGRGLQSPSGAVICWTRDGKATGGTGQAMRLALARGVPVFNLHCNATMRQALALLEAGA